jgi:hypothetical protein
MIFGFSPIVPALFAGDNSNLPACCRRLGRHHCAMLPVQLPVGVALSGVCDQYGRSSTVLAPPGYARAAFFSTSRTVSGAAACRHAAAEQSRALHRISFSRSRQKRGPPSLNI